ncbi:unnamed protein product [Mytilus coruscus]|uniref:Uncharacterized protein n=1 Tax=Mytilus coruscus TaxID=42192 RepID=A0A6J8EVA0_MYTCO|nr:unnamed protein product [Mytilus coruscus]
MRGTYQTYRNRHTRITTLNDKTIYGAKEYVKSRKIHRDTSVILIQVGSNDLHEGEVDNVMKEYESLVNFTMNTYQDSEVVLDTWTNAEPKTYFQDNLTISKCRQKTKEVNEKSKILIMEDFNSCLCQDLDYIIDDSTDLNDFRSNTILPQNYSVDEISKKRNKQNN